MGQGRSQYRPTPRPTPQATAQTQSFCTLRALVAVGRFILGLLVGFLIAR